MAGHAPTLARPACGCSHPHSTGAAVEGTWQLAPDSRYEGRLGTSISTAHVTGVIALMLQVDPTLDPATVRGILRNTARHDGFTAAGSDRQWGAGKLDALAAVRAVRNLRAGHQYIPLVARGYRRPQLPTLTPTATPTVTPTPWPPGPIPESQ